MTATQHNSNWWIQSSWVYDPARIALRSKAQARNQIEIDSDWEASELEGAIKSIPGLLVEDEVELEVAGDSDESESDVSAVDITSGEVTPNAEDAGAVDNLIASAMRQIGLIEAAMREHQLNGFVSAFNEEKEAEAQDPGSEEFNESFTQDLQDDPTSAFAATNPGQYRLGLFSLLKA